MRVFVSTESFSVVVCIFFLLSFFMFSDKKLGYDLIRFILLSDISGKQNSVFEII